ncbi:MAG: S24/S26 family peptidase [Clostridia bacterium]|nr:S24/S26 family peptidase [Clostridia bacterium]
MKSIEKILEEEKVFVGVTQGDSMYPMLVSGRDRVVISPPVFPLKKYDVPLYKRYGHYTLHRIVKVTKHGKYIICGDNRTHLEMNVTEKDIIGVLTAFYRDDKYVECTDKEYIRYSKKVCRSLPWRRMKEILKSKFHKD